MKYKLLIILSCCAQQVYAQKKAATSAALIPAAANVNMTPTDSFSYAIGLNVALNLKSQGINTVDIPWITKSFSDVYGGRKLMMSLAEANRLVEIKFDSILRKRSNEQKLVSLDFLSENKKRPGVITTESGLQYEIMIEGKGPKPADSSVCKIYYYAYLPGGAFVDSTKHNAPPVTVRLQNLLRGWAEGLRLMPAGSKYRFYIPFYLAFGDRGSPPAVPPGANIIYETELTEVKE